MVKSPKPIRVLHVVTIMNRAGIETMLMNYYRHIDRTKIQFDFLVHRTEKGAYDDEIKKLGGRIYYAPAISIKNIFNYSHNLEKFFKAHPEYTIVHSHLDAISAFPLSAAKKAGVPVRIAHSHVNGFDRDFKLAVRYLARRTIPNYATDFFASSSDAAKFMFGRDKEFTIINNAIDIKKFAFSVATRERFRKVLNLENKLVIGHVGRFNNVKNHLFLIDIFYEIHKVQPSAGLMLVGDGELQNEVRNKVEKLSLNESVLFMGVRSDISDLMQAMDVFVLPSRYEGLGIVLIEAQLSGLACVASDKVPLEADISGLCKFINLRTSADLWAKTIVEFCAHPKKRNHLRVQDRTSHKIKEYDIRLATLKLQSYYQNQGR